MLGTRSVGRIVMVCLALACSPPVLAKAAVKGGEGAQPRQSRQGFIERSLVLMPERAGDFRLGDSNDYPDRPDLGVGMRYSHPDFPSVRLDVFVYPIGRVERDQALQRVLAEVREGVEAGVQKGVYANVVMDEEAALDLARVAEDGSLVPDSGATAAAGAAAAEPSDAATGADAREPSLDEALAAMSGDIDRKTDWRLGRWLSMRLDYHGEPQDSLAFAFYRGLYLYKGRISASPVDVPSESLQRLGRHAMAVLIPALQVRNAGSCSYREIQIDTTLEGDEAARQLAGKVLASNAQDEAENCAETLDDTVPEGYRGQPLVFDPANWRDGP